MFEWDDAKNAANIAKHGIEFALAMRIFEGRVVSWLDTRVDYGEERWISIGLVEGVLLLNVVHTDRNGNRRIISARRANRKERARYDQAL